MLYVMEDESPRWSRALKSYSCLQRTQQQRHSRPKLVYKPKKARMESVYDVVALRLNAEMEIKLTERRYVIAVPIAAAGGKAGVAALISC